VVSGVAGTSSMENWVEAAFVVASRDYKYRREATKPSSDGSFLAGVSFQILCTRLLDLRRGRVKLRRTGMGLSVCCSRGKLAKIEKERK